MKYKAKAYIKDGKVLCASQMCDECEYGDIYGCEEVVIEAKDKQLDLILKLFNVSNVVYMTVIEQNEDDRGCGILIEENGLCICSDEYPKIEKHGIYIMGSDRSSDHGIESYDFDSEEEAKRYVHDINRLVSKYNNRLTKMVR